MIAASEIVEVLVLAALLVTATLVVRSRVRRARLRWRRLVSGLLPGPGAEAARLQRELVRSVGAARAALATARSRRASVGDLPGLLERLDRLAAAECAALDTLAAAPPTAATGRQLAEARERVRSLLLLAGDLHAGAAGAIAANAPEDPHHLAGDVTGELTALREGWRRSAPG